MGKLVLIAQFYDSEEAYCAKGYLSSYGIDTIIQNEHRLTMAPWLRVALGGYRLLTFADFEEDARQALENISTNNNNKKLEDQSSTEEVRGGQKRRVRNWLWLPIAFLMNVPFIPLYRSKRGLFVQICALFLVYATFVVVIFSQYN